MPLTNQSIQEQQTLTSLPPAESDHVNDHGDEYKGDLIANFSSNVWFAAQNEGLYAHLSANMHLLDRYPEQHNDSLRVELAQHYGLSASQLMLNNGSIEGIYLIAQAYRAKKSLIIKPTFSEYAKACRANGHQIVECSSSELETSLEREHPNLVWICTPNNPDGTIFEKTFLENLVQKFSETMFIFDISFAEYCREEQPTVSWGALYPNTCMLYSFTKRYGIPGLRIGFISSMATNISRLNSFRPPWSVNALAAAAIRYLLNVHSDNFDIQAWLREKEKFTRMIHTLDSFECVDSHTPFFVVKLRWGLSADLKQFLLENKLLIRDASSFYTDGNQYIRLLTLSSEQNTLLVRTLQQWEQQLAH